jgi:hypothetical protein
MGDCCSTDNTYIHDRESIPRKPTEPIEKIQTEEQEELELLPELQSLKKSRKDSLHKSKITLASHFINEKAYSVRKDYKLIKVIG